MPANIHTKADDYIMTTGYDRFTLDYAAAAWPQHEKLPLSRRLFLHLGFPE